VHCQLQSFDRDFGSVDTFAKLGKYCFTFVCVAVCVFFCPPYYLSTILQGFDGNFWRGRGVLRKFAICW